MTLRRFTLGALAVLVPACTFDVAGVVVDGGAHDLPFVSDLAGTDGNVPIVDLAGLCTNGGPQAACSADGMTLLHCVGSQTQPQSCMNGCVDPSSPHCASLDPGGPAMPSDYLAAGLADVTISDSTLFDSDSGAISGNGFQRASGTGVVSGVGFRVAQQADGSSVGIFSFRSLTIGSNGQVALSGSHVTTLVAAGTIEIDGTVDAQGTCLPGDPAYSGGGLGGSPSPTNGGKGGGPGGGGGGVFSQDSNFTGGGGGGGYGDSGAAGATLSGNANGGSGGAAFGDLTVDDPILSGGSGGGAGGGAGGGMKSGGSGGSGGGGVQIAANGTIVIGSAAVIQAGGCAGQPNKSSPSGGGGGGAGGAILLEAGGLTLAGGATIASNGGAGAGGGSGSPGENGQDSSMPALGGVGGAGPSGTNGGNGGYGSSTAGGLPDMPGMSDTGGGGGGGAVGRIALKSKSGSVDTSNAILSPSLGKPTNGKPATTVGTARFN